ncbi:MarR family winged helix-turn-helix transcriptional regulator [Caulobacter sp. RHG1]|uniref:MarR family winged helix-turn-helix transcriptional regulator n=1 Tax=Caulobacter sp. (strain RHG1) TaxID=2545762 RepID=UPI00155500BC|nr:MarR family transcriptional regulator [Caulobacter sp. RHG1]NQE62646.1 Transcriptional regulator, MarR family [Caulobacter sp. RHG1]
MTPPRTVDERIFARTLLRLARVYRREVNRALGAHGISDAKAMPVLSIARAGGGLRQGVLAEELGVEGPSLVRILDQLCQTGLVERRDDPTDKRAKTLHLTAEGEALATVVEDAVQVVRAQMLIQVSDADLAATLRTFAAFEAALDVAAGQGG